MLTITHTAAEGTLIDGTVPNDPANEVLKRNGWRWGRSIRQWYIPSSRDKLPKLYKINTTVSALQAAGFEVEVEIDEELRPTATVEADRAAHLAERAEHLADRADRHTAAAEAASTRAHELADRIPFGQPIIVGHYSEARMRKAYDDIGRAQDRAHNAYELATESERRAEVAARHADLRNAPHTVARRIDKLEADLRRFRRNGQTALAEQTAEQLTYWQGIREEQVSDGTAPNILPGQVKAGDAVRYTGRWFRVMRVNKRTVTVENPFIAGRGWDPIRWHEIDEHRPAGRPEPAPWPEDQPAML